MGFQNDTIMDALGALGHLVSQAKNYRLNGLRGEKKIFFTSFAVLIQNF